MNENKIEIFKNAEFGSVRTLEINGEPYFVGKDVAEILGYSRPDHAITKHIDDEDKLMYQIDTSGQNRNMFIINESGLYSLILSSKLPNAKKFKHWVTAEVLPAIRKHGVYAIDTLSPQLQYLISMEKKQNELERRQQELESKFADVSNIQENAIKATIEFGRIGYSHRMEISKAVKKRAIEICCYAETYDKVGKSVINSIYNALQKKFDVKSYLDLAYNQYTDAMIFIQYFEPNRQLCIKILHAQPKTDTTILNMLFNEPHENTQLKGSI